MSKIDLDLLMQYHEEAMDIAENALINSVKEKGNKQEKKLKYEVEYEKALVKEMIIADALINSEEIIEPSRSIICLSAACLADSANNKEKKEYYANKVIEFNCYSDLVADARKLLIP